MGNQFIINPMGKIILDAEKIYGVEQGIIQIKAENSKAVIDKVKNVITLEGCAKGRNRTANAIEAAMKHKDAAAKEFDLFTADKVLLQIRFSKDYQMLAADCADIVQFANLFLPTTSFYWGWMEDDGIKDDELVVRIFAANLEKK